MELSHTYGKGHDVHLVETSGHFVHNLNKLGTREFHQIKEASRKFAEKNKFTLYPKLQKRRDLGNGYYGFSNSECVFDYLFFNHGVACCVMSMNSKRRREQASPLQCFTSLQQRRLQKRNRLERHGQSQALMLPDKQTSCNRQWEDMNHDILICIMKKLKWYEWGNFEYAVCKSWVSAFLDVLFPPGDTLDLRILDDDSLRDRLDKWASVRFYHCLMLKLNRRSASSPYTKLILCQCVLDPRAYSSIAQRLPAIKTFISPEQLEFYFPHTRKSYTAYPLKPGIQCHEFISDLMCQPHWKNLIEVECHMSMAMYLSGFCKSIRSLKVTGTHNAYRWIQECIPSAISNGFPLLDRLSFSSTKLTLMGMARILDRHKNIPYLDMEHTNCGEAVPIDDGAGAWNYSWPNDLSAMISRAENFLTWGGQICPNCSHLYSRSLEFHSPI